MLNLLLIEGDQILGEILQCAFNDDDYRATWLQRSNTAREVLKTNIFDVIILALDLPKRPDVELLQSLCNDYNTTPVIMLTGNECGTERRKYYKINADINITFTR